MQRSESQNLHLITLIDYYSVFAYLFYVNGKSIVSDYITQTRKTKHVNSKSNTTNSS